MTEARAMSDAKLAAGEGDVGVGEEERLAIETVKALPDADLPALIAYDVTKTDRATQLRLREAVATMERIGVGGDEPTDSQLLVRHVLERAAKRQAEKV